MSKWLHLIAMAVLVVSSLLSVIVYKRITIITALAGLAALYVGFQRDTYLPFLGETVMPCSVLKEQEPEHADTAVSVSGLEPGAKVLYWASEPATDGLATIKTWDRAYLEFANAGVTRVGTDGHVVLRVRKPQPYTVPVIGRLESHVHWRVCQDGGFLGPVQITPVAH